MKFVVTRASDHLDKEEKPCQEASPVTLTYIIRGTKEGDIKEKRKAWILVIQNLDELMRFVKKYTENYDAIIIERSDFEELEYDITIQDEPF